jgi:hypothetical protein
LSGKKKGGHGERINSILSHFGLHQNPAIVKTIVDVRNNLFHQGLWGTTNPMSGRDEDEYRAMRYLHEIVKRCLFKIVGVDSSFVRSNWEGVLSRKSWD